VARGRHRHAEAAERLEHAEEADLAGGVVELDLVEAEDVEPLGQRLRVALGPGGRAEQGAGVDERARHLRRVAAPVEGAVERREQVRLPRPDGPDEVEPGAEFVLGTEPAEEAGLKVAAADALGEAAGLLERPVLRGRLRAVARERGAAEALGRPVVRGAHAAARGASEGGASSRGSSVVASQAAARTRAPPATARRPRCSPGRRTPRAEPTTGSRLPNTPAFAASTRWSPQFHSPNVTAVHSSPSAASAPHVGAERRTGGGPSSAHVIGSSQPTPRRNWSAVAAATPRRRAIRRVTSVHATAASIETKTRPSPRRVRPSPGLPTRSAVPTAESATAAH